MTRDDSGELAHLPASFAIAWGVRTGAAKGPRRGLSLDRIVAAGVRVATEEGLDAVSMGRVARELDTSAMSLYRYVAAKDELLALMVDAALGEVRAVAAEDGWRPSLERWAWFALTAYRRHPWALEIPIKGPPITPNATAYLDQGLRCLTGTPLAPGEKLAVVLATTSYTRSWAMLRAEIDARPPDAPPLAEALTAYANTLRTLTTPRDFPALHEILAANAFEENEDDPDWDFRFGLARLLDGCDTLIEQRG